MPGTREDSPGLRSGRTCYDAPDEFHARVGTPEDTLWPKVTHFARIFFLPARSKAERNQASYEAESGNKTLPGRLAMAADLH